MGPTAALPHDPRLPGLVATRCSGLARAIPALGLPQEGGGVELVLCGYHPGARATLDARVGQRRFAVKTFADDPAPEAALYQALGAAGLAGDSGARVPPLLAWDHDLRVLVIGWLEGPTTHELVKQGQGRRAGELAAQWVQRTVSLPVELDAGMFLATLSRLRLLHQAHAGEATLAEQAFLEGTRGMLDERALAWHRAAALLQLTERLPIAGRGDWRARAHALLAEAMRLAKHAAPRESIASRRRAGFRFKSPALELVLQAPSTRPAPPEEREQNRKLLSEDYNGAP